MRRGGSMARLLRVELGRAFKSKSFWVAVGIGCALAVVSAVPLVQGFFSDLGFMAVVHYFEEQGASSNHLPVVSTTVYNSFLGGDYTSFVNPGTLAFFMLLPLLAILPYGWTLSSDMRSGYLKTVVPRLGRKRYFLTKGIVSFLSGGSAVLIPLVLSLLFFFMLFPAQKPDIIYDQYGTLLHGNMWAALYNQHPLVYTLLYLGIDFIFAGLFSCLSVSAAFLFRQKLAPMIVPYLFLYSGNLVSSWTRYLIVADLWIMDLLLNKGMGFPVRGEVILVWFVLCVALTVPVIWRKGRRYEIF